MSWSGALKACSPVVPFAMLAPQLTPTALCDAHRINFRIGGLRVMIFWIIRILKALVIHASPSSFDVGVANGVANCMDHSI